MTSCSTSKYSLCRIGNYLALLFLAVIIVESCKSSVANSSKVDPAFYLQYDLTGCRGTCPAYRITVDSVGHVVYEGYMSVEKMGKFYKTISSDQMKKLVSLIEEYAFWDYEVEYGGGIADLPSVILEAHSSEQKHRVRDIRGGPERLKSLQKLILDTIGDDGYVKSGDDKSH